MCADRTGQAAIAVIATITRIAHPAVLARGISEALITTAAGLAAAIPGVIGYNHFTQTMREFAARMDDFSLEFLNAVERERDRGETRIAAEMRER